ncbi:MAG: hypothetical protein J6B31_04280 [Bacteroidaceae bacterium]|nr:hypothetical protein [Bacteroidaceae bacterium]
MYWLTTRVDVNQYDQFLYIDGQMVDFTDYYPERIDNVTVEDVAATSTRGAGKKITHECKVKYLGRNFYSAVITNVYQRNDYDPNQMHYFGGTPQTIFVHGIGDYAKFKVSSNKKPVVEFGEDWMELESITQLGVSQNGPEGIDVYDWEIKFWIDETKVEREGTIYLKYDRGNIWREVPVHVQGISGSVGNYECSGSALTSQNPDNYDCTISASGGTFVLKVFAREKPSVSWDKEYFPWLTLTSSSSSGEEHTFTFNVAPYSEPILREDGSFSGCRISITSSVLDFSIGLTRPEDYIF